MPTEVLYRKWRPQRFADVSGQPVVTRTLINALAQHKVSHAYLFSGPRGTGKTTTARLLAKAINCEKNAADAADSPGEPCNECPACVAYSDGRALDLIEIDAASNRGIEDAKRLRENANYAPTGGALAHKVYLFDEVHMLTTEAFNALLKTIEEPPPHIIFILATTDAHKVPATITSRCQRQDFKRIPHGAIVDRLAFICEQEGIQIPREGLDLVARSATGSLRDAINLLEQVCDSYGREASLEAVREGLGLVADERAALLAGQALRNDLANGLTTIGGVKDDGLDLRQFQKEVVARMRDLLLVEANADSGGRWTPEQIEDMRKEIEGVQRDKMVRTLRLFSEADLRADPLSPLPLELALAESTLAPAAAAQPRTDAPRPAPPAARAAPPPPGPAAPPRAEAPRTNGAPAREPTAAARAERPMRKPDVTGSSAEEIARMLGSKAAVIPPASDHVDEPPAELKKSAPATADAGVPAAKNSDAQLDTLVDQLRVLARPKSPKLDALLNGSCRAVSWRDGILTLGFFADAFQKKTVEESKNKKIYEELAASILGAPVSIRCIIAPKPAARQSSSPLVKHAVENHGATIVSEE